MGAVRYGINATEAYTSEAPGATLFPLKIVYAICALSVSDVNMSVKDTLAGLDFLLMKLTSNSKMIRAAIQVDAHKINSSQAPASESDFLTSRETPIPKQNWDIMDQ